MHGIIFVKMRRMTRELSKRESYEWLRSTLQRVASIPRLSEDDYAYTVFEVLDVDVRSALSEVVLNRLDLGHSARTEIASLRSEFLVLIDAAPSFSDTRWVDVARWSERIVSEYVHEIAA